MSEPTIHRTLEQLAIDAFLDGRGAYADADQCQCAACVREREQWTR